MYKEFESIASFLFPAATRTSYVLKCTSSIKVMQVFHFLDLHTHTPTSYVLSTPGNVQKV